LKKLIYSKEDLDLILSLETQEYEDKINNLQSKIDKANELIKDWHQEYNGLMETNNIYIPKDKPSLFDLRDILKEDK
jgi:hypothetical protein